MHFRSTHPVVPRNNSVVHRCIRLTRDFLRTAVFFWFILISATQSQAALLISDPDQKIRILHESATIIFDPLASSQTTLIRFEMVGATKPFSLFIPIAGKPKMSFGHVRSFSLMRSRVHPISRANRSIKVAVSSWVGSCLVPEVGVEKGVTVKKKRSLKPIESAELKTEVDTRRWLMDRGMLLAPAQVAWMRQLRRAGWSFVAVAMTPPATDDATEPMYSPVITLTHETNDIAYNVHQPPSTITDGPNPVQVPLELAILTEWPVGPETEKPMQLIMSQPITTIQLRRMAKRARGLPWGFRRDGSVTAYSLANRSNLGILRFTKMESLPRKDPHVRGRNRPVHINVPIEIILLAIWLTVWAWRGRSRRLRLRHRARKVL